MAKIIVFGLDGGSWNLLKPWIKSGELKTFRKFVEEGSWGTFESTYPPVTMPAWPALLMSKTPEKLKIYEFLRRSDQNYNTSINSIDYNETLWQILTKHNKTSYIINIPLTRLPSEEYFKGVFITGPFLNFGEITNNLRVKNLIKKFDYLIDTPIYHNKFEKKFIKEIINRSKNQIRLIKVLLEENWDLLFYVNYFTDTISHYFWKYLDDKYPFYIKNNEIVSLIKEFYRVLDNFLSYIKNKADYIFVVSDHGFGPLLYEINLNKWLAMQGLLKYKKSSSFGFINKYINKILNKVKSLISYEVLTGIQLVISGWLKSFFRKNQYFVNKNLYLQNIDFKNSNAYSMYYGGITINLKGREPFGNVDKDEYEFLRTKIINNIMKLRGPNGRNIVEKAWKVEDFYQNPSPIIFPDIVLQFRNFNYLNRVTLTKNDKLFENGSFSGTHEQEGIIIAYGKDIKGGSEIKNVKIYDLLPTLLHIFSIPSPSDIDGNVILDIFDEDSKFRNLRINKIPESLNKKTKLKGIIQETFKKDSRI